MLKIKDNVDLKELEKYGFKCKYNEDTGELDKLELIYNDCDSEEIIIIIREIDKEIEMGRLSIYDKYEILYDLIKDGLVEKVEE